MSEKMPNGAQLLIVKDDTFNKVTSFTDFPVDIQDLTPTNLSEEEFVKNGKVGFILADTDEQSATIKFLNTENSDLKISFGERKDFMINNEKYLIEVWAIRHNTEDWADWKISL